MKPKMCVQCKTKPIWKGNKHIKNYWGLYCETCETEFKERMEKKQTIIQIGREFYELKHLPTLTVQNKSFKEAFNIQKLKKILEEFDVRLLKEAE